MTSNPLPLFIRLMDKLRIFFIYVYIKVAQFFLARALNRWALAMLNMDIADARIIATRVNFRLSLLSEKSNLNDSQIDDSRKLVAEILKRAELLSKINAPHLKKDARL